LSIEKNEKRKISVSVRRSRHFLPFARLKSRFSKQNGIYLLLTCGGFWLDFNSEKKYTFYDPIEGCSGFYILKTQKEEMCR